MKVVIAIISVGVSSRFRGSKEPLEDDASHVRNAIARFDPVKGVSDAERDEAWKRIQAAAKRFGVEVREQSWREPRKS